MSTRTSFAWCSDCGYIGPDFKTEEYLPYVDEGRKMPGGKDYECPKCGLTTGEQVIQEHFESLESEVHGLKEKLKTAEENYRQDYNMAAGFSHDFEKRAKSAEAEVKTLKEQLEITARLGGEQAREVIDLNAQLIKAESRLVKAQELCKLECEKCLKDNPNDPLQEYDCLRCRFTEMMKVLGVAGGEETK